MRGQRTQRLLRQICCAFFSNSNSDSSPWPDHRPANDFNTRLPYCKSSAADVVNMPVPVPARLAALASIRAQIFQTLHNPSGRHTGVQYLTRKLRGPLKVDYYPDPRPIKFKQLNAALRVEMEEHGFTGRSLDYWQLPDLREEKRYAAHGRLTVTTGD